MKNKFTYHYEVRFNLLAFDKNNNVLNESHIKVLHQNTPLENRTEAFEEFNHYLSFLGATNRIKKDDLGNYRIIQPSFISEIIDKKEKSEDYFELRKTYNQFREELSVFLVVDDPDISKNVIDAFCYDDTETEFEIHRVSSLSYNPQNIVDNLDMHEMPLFEHFQINTDNLKTTVYHYGEDYAESGEDKEDGAKRIILKTPHVWDPIEKYNEVNIENQDTENATTVDSLDFFEIIAGGESNQVELKPCLLYNFKTQAPGIGIKYIIAKAICGFLNSNGGVLFIGVNDDGKIQGLENFDYSLFKGDNDRDKMLLELDSLIAYFFGIALKPIIQSSIVNLEGKDVFIITVQESPKPVFLKNKKYDKLIKEFYVRMNASTRQIVDPEELIDYVYNKEWKNEM